MLRTYTDLSFQRQKASKTRPNSVKRDCAESYIIGYLGILLYPYDFRGLPGVIRYDSISVMFCSSRVAFHDVPDPMRQNTYEFGSEDMQSIFRAESPDA